MPVNETVSRDMRINQALPRMPEAPGPSSSFPAPEEWSQRALADMRREVGQMVEWQVQQHLPVRSGPTPMETVLALGSVVAGAAVTAVLVMNATTVNTGFLGTQTISHYNTLPLVVVVWLALLVINVVWARRR
jgi:hypothetical protein